MYSKEQQLYHKRRKPKRGNQSRITQKVRQEVQNRSQGQCERCGRTSAYSFEMAHLINASQGGVGNNPNNIVLLCGPKVNTNTCHQWADETREGREWKQAKHKELKDYYGGI